jgi:uncharacterized cupredoxin-like copper-binding protein
MAAAAAVIALAAGGCGGGSSAPATTAPASGAQIVTAKETEYEIALSTMTLHPGTVTFRAVNDGSITHALAISGPGLSEKSTPNFPAGQVSSLTVTLTKPGHYMPWCPVDGHRRLGMVTEITVR